MDGCTRWRHCQPLPIAGLAQSSARY